MYWKCQICVGMYIKIIWGLKPYSSFSITLCYQLATYDTITQFHPFRIVHINNQNDLLITIIYLKTEIKLGGESWNKKMKNKKYHTVGTVLKSNRTIVDRQNRFPLTPPLNFLVLYKGTDNTCLLMAMCRRIVLKLT